MYHQEQVWAVAVAGRATDIDTIPRSNTRPLHDHDPTVSQHRDILFGIRLINAWGHNLVLHWENEERQRRKEGENIALYDSLRFHSLPINDRSSFTKAMPMDDKYENCSFVCLMPICEGISSFTKASIEIKFSCTFLSNKVPLNVFCPLKITLPSKPRLIPVTVSLLRAIMSPAPRSSCHPSKKGGREGERERERVRERGRERGGERERERRRRRLNQQR